MADLTNPEAVAYVQERFRRMGVERALARAGARDGDLVRIGPIELEYVGEPVVKVVVKVGTSSITSESGELDDAAVVKLCGEVATARTAGHEVVLVCSGAIAAGLPALGLSRAPVRHGDAPGRRGGRPAAAHGAHRARCSASTGSSPDRCC